MISISIVTVCLDSASTLSATLDSVVLAGSAVSQLVIIDGGSTDGTVDIIRSYERVLDDRLVWVSESDQGLYFAMNKGLQMVTGDYVLFLGADDTLIEGGLEGLVRAAEAAPQPPGAVFGDVLVVDAGGVESTQAGCATPRRLAGVPRAMPACHQASLYRSADLKALGGFDTEFRIAADYDLYLRLVESERETMYAPVAVARFSLGGVSASNPRATAQEYRRVWIKHGVHPARACFRMWTSLGNATAARLLRQSGALRR